MKNVQNEKILSYLDKDKAIEFMDDAMQRTKKFGILDFAVFKTALISFGVFIGIMFTKPLKKFKIFFLIGYIVSALYLFYRMYVDISED